MKTKIILFLLLIVTYNSFSQTNYEHKISAQVGTSWLGVLTNAIDKISNPIINHCFATPVFQLAYNYKTTPYFTVGAVSSFQNFNFNITIPENNITNADIFISRTNLSFRGLAHYIDNDVIDLYSGGRIGLSVWSIKADTAIISGFMNNYSFNLPMNPKYNKVGSAVSFQIILFGMDIYLSKNIGINGEIAMGPTYFANFGLSYRF